MHREFILGCLLMLGCNSPLPKGVVRVPAGEATSHIAGPMPDFGPFKTYSDALLAACPLLLSLPNAVTESPNNPNFKLHWNLSTEYCAWIYHTPEGQYEMSMVATSMSQMDTRLRTCDLPTSVRDSRYPEESLDYVFVVHNHPVGNPLSRRDIRFIAMQGSIHGFSFKAGEREVPLVMVAFFSHGDSGHPSCDGFFQYIPATGELLKWMHESQGGWTQEKYGSVTWTDPDNFDIELQ